MRLVSESHFAVVRLIRTVPPLSKRDILSFVVVIVVVVVVAGAVIVVIDVVSVVADVLEIKVDKVVDPTGAGDCFIGGIAGYLTQSKNISFDTIKSAIAYGTSIASYNVENIGTKNLLNLSINDIKTRINKLH